MDLFAAMRAFVEIVDRGSLTAAAVSLDRSQPAIVRTLAGLEDRLGARLLNRTTRRLSLTPEGRDYLARCRRILSDVEEAEVSVGKQHAQPRGDITMTAPVLFGQMHVAPAVMGFLHEYDQVRIDLRLFDRYIDLVDEGIDLGVRIGKLGDSTLVASRVGEVRRVVCASPELLDRVDSPTYPTQLTGKPCVRFNGLSSPDVWGFRANGKDFNVHVSGSLSCNQLAVARDACLRGQGFGQFLSYQVQPYIEDGSLRRVLHEFEPDPVPVSLVYPSARLVSTRVRALIEWLKLELQATAFAY